MAKGSIGTKVGGSIQKGGVKVWTPQRPGNNKPSMTGKPSGDGRGNYLQNNVGSQEGGK
jgi:hypothetical protein